MAEMTQPGKMEDFVSLLRQFNGRMFADLKPHLLGRKFDWPDLGGQLEVLHIQGSTGADPASVIAINIPLQRLHLDSRHIHTSVHQRALFDFLNRTFAEGVKQFSKGNRGDEGSGTFQPVESGQEILERNTWRIGPNGTLQGLVRMSLPGKRPAKLLAEEAIVMLTKELLDIIHYIASRISNSDSLDKHLESAVIAEQIAECLDELGLVAFIGDGAILPRQSGVSQLPMERGKAVPFKSPDSLAVTVKLPCQQVFRGLAIPKGVTVIIGGGYHGKSTLLNALARGVYAHVPGDGRELVVTERTAMLLRAEDGRCVRGVNIAGFVRKLPGGSETEWFTTDNASGSTSQAASLVEAIWAGCKLVLLDEDTSAANFLSRDRFMRKLVPDDPLVPLVYRVRELWERFGVSVIVVAGCNSQFLNVADCVIEMRDWLPRDRTHDVDQLPLDGEELDFHPITCVDDRCIISCPFDPHYVHPIRQQEPRRRVKPLRGQPRVLEFGNEQIDLTAVAGLVDPDQVMAIGQLFLYAYESWGSFPEEISPTELAAELDHFLEKNGLQAVEGESHLYLARPRRVDIAAAVNRIRTLQVGRKHL